MRFMRFMRLPKQIASFEFVTTPSMYVPNALRELHPKLISPFKNEHIIRHHEIVPFLWGDNGIATHAINAEIPDLH